MAYDFAELLRRARLEAGLSQEALAERAGVSAVAISGYERGLSSIPRRTTIASLADALHLERQARSEFENAAHRKHGSPLTDERHHNLPWQPTSFIGRHREVKELSALIARRRLLTVTGAGGIGKTRTVLETASRLAPCPRDGIWFVDLAPLADGPLVLSKILSTLNLQLPEREHLLAGFVRALKTRELLLILDNCEHVVRSVREIAMAILPACPNISLLATSRERIGVIGEHIYRLSALSVPSEGATAQGQTYDALDLFTERATTVHHTFVFSDEHLEIAAHICRRLDGNALAIELVAARLPVLGLAELQSQLAKHFRVVTAGHDGLPARQRTLYATISWSHDLLGEQERALFRKLAVFARGWTLDAAEAVCAKGASGNLSVLDTLFSLVEKSLVVLDLEAAVPRYSFFESTRAYASEQLLANVEALEMPRRHAQWMATLADRAYESFLVEPRRSWELAFMPELDNAIAALEWALGSRGDDELAGRIACGFQGFWVTAGLGESGQRYVNALAGRVEEREHPALLARLLVAQSKFLHGTARADVQRRAIALLEHTGDRRMLAHGYSLLAYALAQTGQYLEAVEANNAASALIHQESFQLSSLYLGVLGVRSRILRRQGHLPESREALAEALLVAEETKDVWATQRFQALLADIEFAAGDTQHAVAVAEVAIASPHRVRGSYDDLYLLCNLACYQLVLGQLDSAGANAREALLLARSSDEFIVHTTIQHLAAVAALRTQPSIAARLLGFVDAWYERIGYHRDPTDQKGYDVLIGSLREQLSTDAISALLEQGVQLAIDAAVEHALGVS